MVALTAYRFNLADVLYIVDQNLTTLEGERLVVRSNAQELTISGAHITSSTHRARNGIIHIIDRVLIPPSLMAGSIMRGSGVYPLSLFFSFRDLIRLL